MCVLLPKPKCRTSRIYPHCGIPRRSALFSVLHVPGEGTYGNVLKCTHMATDVTVAVKMMKNEGLLMEQASSEVSKKFQ